ncbi:hypothetical protein HLH36_18835 [Gluconacetobacter aggeris]|uniref:Uncharacterized protein n=1 Tax=Gluconacetobacter aggeris TaxID=1286186 RepID=A0A7W4IX65_9PROT|nr:hypothetical protein [Gluconacetobacter aggeris]
MPSFGTFTVRAIKAQPRINPATGAPVAGRAGRTVRFKASPLLKTLV